MSRRKRWRVVDIIWWKIVAGFSIKTKGGLLAVSFGKPRYALHTIRKNFPHLHEELKAQGQMDEKGLKEFFVGRYIYGEVKTKIDSKYGKIDYIF